MKAMKYLSMLVMLLCMVSFSACSNDDDEDQTLTENTLVGTHWRSYKHKATYQGKTETEGIVKNGENTELYFEIAFEKDNVATLYLWPDEDESEPEDGESCQYEIQGNKVVITEPNGGTINLTYEAGQLYWYQMIDLGDDKAIYSWVYFTK